MVKESIRVKNNGFFVERYGVKSGGMDEHTYFRNALQWSLISLIVGCFVIGTSHGEGLEITQKPGFPEMPKVGLAESKNAESQQDDHAGYWSRRVTGLIEAAERAGRTLDTARFELAAANLILGRQLEPVTSAMVAGISKPDEGNRQKIEESLELAEKLISKADALLAAEPNHVGNDANDDKPANDVEKDEKPEVDRAQLLHASETLRSFLNGLRAFLLTESDQAARRRAASALAPLLEDSDKKVSAAAKLWQALLRGSEADPSAALKILDAPMASPGAETWPFGLYAKVIRCRFQGMQGSWSAALVMLTHLEEQLDDWVPEASHRGDARRLFAWMRLEVLRRWHEALPAESQTEQAWCARETEETIKSYFSVEMSVLRLEPAIPLLFAEEVFKVETK